MNLVTEMAAGIVTATVLTDPTSSRQQPPIVISCTTNLETSDVHCERLKARNTQAPPVSRSTSPRPASGLTFARRRHSKSLDSPYLSRPRMKRRGAVSYDKNDAAAEYIRYLGAERKTFFACAVTSSVIHLIFTQVTRSASMDKSVRVPLSLSCLLINVSTSS